MAGWYSGGTVTVTNGSTVVTGAGTDFVNNVAARDAFALVGGNPNEIASVQSATQLTLARPWLGATGGGQAYVVIPTVGIYVDLALRALNMLTPFQAVLDGVGQGLFGDGSVAAPGMRFIADQDTGIYRDMANCLSFAAGGVRAAYATVAGLAFDAGRGIHFAANAQEILIPSDGASGWILQTNGAFTVRTIAGTKRFAIEADGRLTAPAGHVFARPGTSENMLIAGFGFDLGTGIQVRTAQGPAANAAACALWVNANSTNGRSINAGGTINASGADYAEYLTKAPGCGTIAKGDVCGVTRDGLLTRTWADAVRFVVKSTDPNLVGGDTWASHLPPRPEAPGEAPAAPIVPAPSSAAVMPAEPIREDGENDDAFIRRMAAYLVAAAAAMTAQQADAGAMAAYQADLATYPQRKAEHDAAVAAYDAALSEWDDDLETARQTVDRIAFCGQVPVNVDAANLHACEAALADGEAVYLVAVARGGGIGVTAVREGDMTLPLYMRRIGAVWAIRDGRPWIDVQHG